MKENSAWFGLGAMTGVGCILGKSKAILMAHAVSVLQEGIFYSSFDCFRFDGRPVDGTGPAGDRHWSDEPPAGFSKESCCYNCSEQELQQLAATCRAKIPAANFATVVTGLIPLNLVQNASFKAILSI